MLVRAIVTYVALAVSLAANAWLIADRMGESKRTDSACALRAAEGSVQALQMRAGVLDWLVQQTAADQARTFARLDATMTRAAAREAQWQAADLPKPDCGPGQARVDATNAMLGHEQ